MNRDACSNSDATRCMVITLVIWLAAFSSIFSSPAAAKEISRTEHTSAEICGYCHIDIYKSWKESVHSRAYQNPIFMTAYRHAYLETRGIVKDFCLKCHAPTSVSGNDADVTLPVTSEGVTCDFCHTIEAVDLDNPEAPFKVDVGGQKRASMLLFKDRSFEQNPAAHVTAYTEWFNKAELCAGCHEITNLKGVKIGETYTEWEKSEYARRGVQCQDCHMSPIEGKATDPSVKQPKLGTIPDHSLAHDLDSLRGSVALEVLSSRRTDDGMFSVDLAITNVKAGHDLPTGTPSRKLAVSVTIQAETGAAVTSTRRFGKVIVDKDGTRLDTDVDGYLSGVEIIKNTAIKPNERRVANFLFSAPPTGKVSVSARASLIYKAVVTHREEVEIPLLAD